MNVITSKKEIKEEFQTNQLNNFYTNYMEPQIKRMTEKVFNQIEPITTLERFDLIGFLSHHLDEYGDSEENIGFAIDYALNSNPLAGGFVLRFSEDDETTGVLVMNKTGMQGYFPENVLVYIAVHRDFRGQGLGKKLMKRAMQLSKGDISLHVKKDNPVLHLYEKMGFETSYLEMRYYEKKELHEAGSIEQKQ